MTSDHMKPGPRTRDLTGRTFGNWVALRVASVDPQGRARWWCHCICGTDAIVQAFRLVGGTSTQCRTCAAAQSLDTRRRRRQQAEHEARDSSSEL